MHQLVSEIVLKPVRGYGDRNRAQAVVEYVGGLTDRYLDLQELPPKTLQCYFVDKYRGEIITAASRNSYGIRAGTHWPWRTLRPARRW